jgi:DNA-binding response OmpR family regulator
VVHARRVAAPDPRPLSLPPPIRVGPLELDVLRRAVRVGGVVHPLTGSTLGLLYLLAANAGRVLTREEIAGALQPDRPPASNAVDRMVLLLRRRLDVAGLPRMVQTVPGRGYQFAPSPTGPA